MAILNHTPKNIYPVTGDDAIEEINSPEEADQDTQMQAAKDDNTAEPAAGFGIKISSIASTASEEVETGSKDASDETEATKDTTEAGPKTTGTFIFLAHPIPLLIWILKNQVRKINSEMDFCRLHRQ